MNVFLSYSQRDKKWASALGSGLRASGFEVRDPENDILPGENWHLQLGKALERSEAMVVLLSPDSVASKSVLSEIEYALSSSRFRGRLIPVLVRPTADVPWILQKQHFIRASKDLDKTVSEVAAALKESQASLAR